jgi:hypothetical protein
MATTLAINANMTQQIWFQLTHELNIIETDGSRGSYFISHISAEHLNRVWSFVRASDLVKDCIYANCPHLAAMLESIGGWKKSVTYAQSEYKARTSGEENEEVQGLDKEVLRFARLRLNYSFAANEVYYAGNATEFMKKLFGTGGHLKGEIVVLRPTIEDLNWPEPGNYNHFEWEDFKAYELTIEQLPEFCESHTQVIVYYVPAPKFGYIFEEPAESYTRLIKLHQTCRFNLIVHDQLLLIKFNPLIFNALEDANDFLYYIAPLSNLDPDHLNVNMVIGPAREMGRLIKKKGRLGRGVTFGTGYALLCHIQRAHITKYTPIAYSILESRTKAAQEVLISSGLFVEKHLYNPEAGFFYLELKSAEWPNKINELLEKMGIRIILKIVLWKGPQFKKGIMLSINKLGDVKSTRKALQQLIDHSRHLIKQPLN